MAFTMRHFLLAPLICHRVAGMTVAKPARFAAMPQKTRALVVTMAFPDDQVPIDIMMDHQLRMIGGNVSTVEAAIIDNRPPWMEQTTAQEPLLARFRRSYGSTGNVRVKAVDYSKLSDLLNRFFGGSGGIQLNEKLTSLAASVPANLSRLDGKAKAARLLGMLNFLELCADADADVDQCIYLDSTTFVYREGQTGVAEMAAKLFRQDPRAVVLQPPDICTYTKASQKGVCKAANATSLNHGFFVVNRERFEGFAPMQVESADLGSGFEEIFAEGLTKGGVEGAVKFMRCGGAFAIHPYDDSLGKFACHGQQLIGLPKQAHSVMPRTGAALPHGHFDSDYAGFPGTHEKAAALRVLIDRFEQGSFPEAKYPESVTNKCLNMCPSRDRMKEGLAW